MLHTKFQKLGPVVLKKKIFEYISMHFSGSNLGPPGTESFWIMEPWAKDHQAMLHTKFQAPEQRICEEDDF